MKPLWDMIEENLGDDFAEDEDLQELVRELSLAFTEGREHLRPDYLDDPHLQTAYLAYFVPLNFAWDIKNLNENLLEIARTGVLP